MPDQGAAGGQRVPGGGRGGQDSGAWRHSQAGGAAVEGRQVEAPEELLQVDANWAPTQDELGFFPADSPMAKEIAGLLESGDAESGPDMARIASCPASILENIQVQVQPPGQYAPANGAQTAPEAPSPLPSKWDTVRQIFQSSQARVVMRWQWLSSHAAAQRDAEQASQREAAELDAQRKYTVQQNMTWYQADLLGSLDSWYDLQEEMSDDADDRDAAGPGRGEGGCN